MSNNSTIFLTADDEECLLPKSAVVTGIALVFIIMLLGLFGNLLVCIVLLKQHRRTVTCSHLFVISVAISDFFTSATVLPFDIIYWLNFPVWPLSPSICRLWNAFFFTFLSASAIGITEICMDIYIAIKRPLNYCMDVTKKKCYFIIVASWFWCIVLGVLVYMFQEEPPSGEYLFEINNIAFGLYLLIHLIIPFVIVTISYFKLFSIARHHATRVESLKKHESSPTANTAVPKLSKRSSVLSVRQEFNLAKTFGCVTIGFIFCWTPFLIVQLFYVLKIDKTVNWCELELADTVVCWFSYLQCCLNPLVYSLRHRSFRRMVLRTLQMKGQGALNRLFWSSETGALATPPL